MNRYKSARHICFLVIVMVLGCYPVLLRTGVISSSSLVLFLGKCICYAIVAIGLDLIWGYTGILSLGHGLYFCLGAYGMGMYLKLCATHGNITDFMKTGGLKELPFIWKPFLHLAPSIFLMLFIPGALAWVLGYLIFKNRVKGVYFSIISQALTWAGYSLFISLSPYTNGNVGITEIESLAGSLRGDKHIGNLMLMFYSALAVLCAVYILASWLAGTKFGKILVAVRDGEMRTYFSGYNVCVYKTVIYVISAVLAAAAGALFINFNGGITPSQMTIAYSINMIIWVAVGGRGTIIGPVIGALLINLCEYNLSSGSLVDIWQYIIGGLFVVMILFFKGGIIGMMTEQIPSWIGKKRQKAKDLSEIRLQKEAVHE